MTAEVIKIQRKKVMIMVAILTSVAMLALGIGLIAKVKPAEAQISTNAKNLSGLIAVNALTTPYGASGAAAMNGYAPNNLSGLIVLQGLFPTSKNANQNAKDLIALVAVNNTLAYPVNTSAAAMNGYYPNNLGDLIVLNNLFLDP